PSTLRTAHLERLLAPGDYAAVDDARHDWRHRLGRDADHGLVHEPQALVDRALLDARHALRVQSDRSQVRVAAPPPALDRRGPRLVHSVVIAGGLELERNRDQKPALLGALALFPLDQTLRSTAQAARRGAVPPN